MVSLLRMGRRGVKAAPFSLLSEAGFTGFIGFSGLGVGNRSSLLQTGLESRESGNGFST